MHILERMAANPHYKMSKKQLEALKKLRESQGEQVIYAPEIPKHNLKIPKHPTGPEKVRSTDDRDSVSEDNS